MREFLHFLDNKLHLIDEAPELSAIKVKVAPKMPLEGDLYPRLLATISDARTRAFVQLMRHSGLAITGISLSVRTGDGGSK